MDWKLIFGLSLFGLAMGVATVFVIRWMSSLSSGCPSSSCAHTSSRETGRTAIFFTACCLAS